MEQAISTHPNGASVREDSSPAELVAWTLQRFAGQRMIMTTSFGMEGCALIDMYAKQGGRLTVVYLDTRGSGRSEQPPAPTDYAYAQLSADIDALRDHLRQERVCPAARASDDLYNADRGEL